MDGVNAEHYICIDAGVDWLTATGDRGLSGWDFWGVGDGILQTQTAAGVEVKPAAVRDYKGRRGDGVFVGRRASDSIIILSGPRADEHFDKVAQAAANVSRLDVQVTIATGGEQPHLGRDIYQHLKHAPRGRGKPPELEYRVRAKKGETFYHGTRVSDYFGRFYDKASEAQLGEPRTIWRAELETKRAIARALANRLGRVPDRRTAVESVVGAWWLRRGVRLPRPLKEGVRCELRPPDRIRQDELRWLRTATPKAIRRAIDRHGLQSVIEALGLSDLVEVKHGKRPAS